MIDLLTYLFVGALILFVLYSTFTPKSAPLTPETYTGKVRFVVDGDTLHIEGHKPSIRLWGVDAPEKNEAGYSTATNMLKNLTHGQILNCQKIETDRYGRTVARCFLSNGKEVNAEMITSGTATEYRRFTKGFYSK